LTIAVPFERLSSDDRAALEPFIFKWKQFYRSRFLSGQRRSAMRIPWGMGKTIAADPGGKMHAPSGWLERTA
jgi:hypothetical protein